MGFEAIVDAFTEHSQSGLSSNGEMMPSNDARTQPTVLVMDHEAEVRERTTCPRRGWRFGERCLPISMLGRRARARSAGVRWAVFFHINFFHLPVVNVIGTASEVGQIVIAFLFIVPAFFVDRVVARQRSHQQQLRAEQLRILRMTMRTVQDIVGNALMSLYMFRAEAEPSVSHESLALIHYIIADTAERLMKIGDLETSWSRFACPQEWGSRIRAVPMTCPKNPRHGYCAEAVGVYGLRFPGQGEPASAGAPPQ